MENKETSPEIIACKCIMWDIERIHVDLSLCDAFQKSRRHPDEVINDIVDCLERAATELRHIIEEEEKAAFRNRLLLSFFLLFLILYLVYKYTGK